jgi:hypothetical protein
MDDTNISAVFVDGKRVTGTMPTGAALEKAKSLTEKISESAGSKPSNVTVKQSIMD